jgi:AcrR family transcriptional regulator
MEWVSGGRDLTKPGARAVERQGRPRHFDDDTERRMVMDAAVRVIARKSYVSMSVADVLAEAGLSTNSFYRHFDSKDALIAAVVRRDGESAQRSLERVIEAAQDPVAALEGWLDGLLDLFFEPKRAARTALLSTPDIVSSYRVADELMDMRWLLARPLVEVLRAGHKAGVLFSPNPEADAVSMFALASSAAVAPHSYRGDRKAARNHVVRFAWAAFNVGDGTAGHPAPRKRSGQPRQQHAT